MDLSGWKGVLSKKPIHKNSPRRPFVVPHVHARDTFSRQIELSISFTFCGRWGENKSATIEFMSIRTFFIQTQFYHYKKKKKILANRYQRLDIRFIATKLRAKTLVAHEIFARMSIKKSLYQRPPAAAESSGWKGLQSLPIKILPNAHSSRPMYLYTRGLFTYLYIRYARSQLIYPRSIVNTPLA